MHNPNYFRSYENPNEDEGFINDGIASIITEDYFLNYLNNEDPIPNNNRSTNAYPPLFPSMSLQFPGFQDQNRPSEGSQNMMFSKMGMQDSWLMQNSMEAPKIQVQAGLGYTLENPDELEGNVKVKKLKTNKESSLNVKRPSEAISRPKNNTKNTYINRINSLIEEQDVSMNCEVPKVIDNIKIETKKAVVVKNEAEPQITVIPKATGMKKVRSYDVLKFDEADKLNVKLARNRESARKSRKRKKVYIELLEKKVENLQQELDAANKQLEQHSSSINQATVQNKILTNLHGGEQNLFEKLEKMLSSKSDETEISFLIDSLRLRMGAHGKERVSAVNFFFKQVLEYLVPAHMKYLLWSSVEGKDIFSSRDTASSGNLAPNVAQGESTEYWQELAPQMNLTENQKKNIAKYKKKFMAEKQKIEALVSNFNHARKDLLKQTKSLQDIVDDFSNVFSPAQFGRLLMSFEKEKNRKEFKAGRLWIHPSMKKENGGDLSDESDDDDLLESNDNDRFEEEEEEESENPQSRKQSESDLGPARPTKTNSRKKMS